MHRPAVAIISNSQTPYRLHLHRRIAAELPQIKLWSLYTHEQSDSSWAFDAPVEIGPVSFGAGESSADQARPSRAPREWAKASRIINFLIEHDVRFVLVMGYNDLGRLRVIHWCHEWHIPCMVFGDSNIRGDRATGLRAIVKRRLLHWVVSHTSGIFACGSLGREYFEKYGAAPRDIFYFPYEPDYALMQNPPPERVAEVATQFGLRVGRPCLVYSGRLAEVKRVDLLIDAFAAVATELPHWDLVIVGGGSLEAQLKTRVPESLRDRVTWTGFQNDSATLSAIYYLCRVLVLPSDYEPWALVINEAVAAGLAVVCSDVVGAGAELVRDSINGRIFRAGDLKCLVDCLRDVMAPGVAETMRAAAPGILADWRSRGDPVAGLYAALRRTGVLPA